MQNNNAYEKKISKNKLTREIKKAREAQQKLISQGEEFITVEALKQIIYTPQTPEAFDRRFVAAVNIFNVLVFKDKPFSEISQATDIQDAIETFHSSINNFYTRLKEQNVSSEELYEMMQFAIQQDKQKLQDEKLRLEKKEREDKAKMLVANTTEGEGVIKDDGGDS